TRTSSSSTSTSDGHPARPGRVTGPTCPSTRAGPATGPALVLLRRRVRPAVWRRQHRRRGTGGTCGDARTSPRCRNVGQRPVHVRSGGTTSGRIVIVTFDVPGQQGSSDGTFVVLAVVFGVVLLVLLVRGW